MKVRIFAGREHHAHKLNNLFVGLKQHEADVRWVITRNAINIDPSTEFIGRYGEFDHIHSLLDPHAVSEIDRISGDLQHLSIDNGLTRHIAPFWISHSIREAAENLVLFRNYLSREKPHAVVGLHANNFFCTPFLYFAQEMNIPTFVYQEGLLRHRDQETMNKQASAADYVDIMYTWSMGDEASYVDAGVPEGVVRPVGPIHLDGWLNLLASEEQYEQFVVQFRRRYLLGRRPIVSFLPPQVNRYEGNLERAINALAHYCRDARLKFVVKLHPFNNSLADNIEPGLDMLGASVYKDADPLPLIVASNAVLSQHSTTGIESLYLRTPFAQVDLDNVGLEQPVSEHSPTINESSLGTIKELVGEQVSATNPLADGRSTERAIAIMESIAGE